MGKDLPKSRAQRREEERAAKRERQAHMAARRKFLQKAGPYLGLGAVGVTGIGGLVYLMTRPQEKYGNEYSEVKAYYPELMNLQVKQEGSFTTPSLSKNVRWFNFSNFDIDQDKLASNFTFTEQFPSLLGGNYNYSPTDYFDIKPRTKNKVVFIIPAEAPLPSWLKNNQNYNVRDFSIGVTESSSYDDSVTFIRIPNDIHINSHNMTVTNEVFITEACQATVDAVTFSSAPAYAYGYGQEVMCNSLALVYNVKSQAKSYEEYASIAPTQDVGVPFSNDRFQIVTLPENIYNLFPVNDVVK